MGRKKKMAAMHLLARYIKHFTSIFKSANTSGEMLLPSKWELALQEINIVWQNTRQH